MSNINFIVSARSAVGHVDHHMAATDVVAAATRVANMTGAALSDILEVRRKGSCEPHEITLEAAVKFLKTAHLLTFDGMEGNFDLSDHLVGKGEIWLTFRHEDDEGLVWECAVDDTAAEHPIRLAGSEITMTDTEGVEIIIKLFREWHP